MTACLENWVVVPLGDSIALRGFVTGHPKRRDGAQIQTSPVVSASGRAAQTASGTAYELGKPLDPEVDEDEPLAEYLIVVSE